MSAPLAGPGLALAVLLVGLMGAAVQRGATCMVAGVSQLVHEGRADRLFAMAFAGLVVGAVLWLAAGLGWLPPDLSRPRVGWWTAAGGILMGLGAAINGACVFGAVGRLGSGEVVYCLTPVGFLLGALATQAMLPPLPAPLPPVAVMPPLLMPLLLAGALLFLVVRLLAPGLAGAPARLRVALSSPAAATASIGVIFALLILFAGPWTWPEALAALAAHPMLEGLAIPLLLFLSLLGGAAAASVATGRFRLQAPDAAQAARCLAGGALLAVGGHLAPGSNDGLILLEGPRAMPHALVALTAMVGALLLFERRSRRPIVRLR